MLAVAFSTVGDVLAWSGDKLLAPVLTGAFVGLALRAATIPGEVTGHDARVEELNTDLTRWVRDRDRDLEAQIMRASNLARQGEIEDVAQAPVPPELERTTPGSLEDSGAFVARVERLMRQALHEYRDQASGTVRAYGAMARSEGGFHRFLRRRRSDKPSPLRLSAHGRETLGSWRERKVRPTASVADDPTRQDDAADIQPLEEDAGLTWDAAARAAGSHE